MKPGVLSLIALVCAMLATALPAQDEQALRKRGEAADQQEITARITELSRQTQLIKIKYKKIRDQNRIKRREEKRKLLGR